MGELQTEHVFLMCFKRARFRDLVLLSPSFFKARKATQDTGAHLGGGKKRHLDHHGILVSVDSASLGPIHLDRISRQ
jgi:hypothetical protein